MKRSVEGKRVVVAGMGSSGVAASLLLQKRGAEVTASDIKFDEGVRRGGEALRDAGIKCEIGRQGIGLLRSADMVVLSPGIGSDSEIVKASHEMGVEVTNSALQIFGGYGYSREYPMEWLVRFARGWTIAGGTAQIQRNNVAYELLKGRDTRP